MYDVNGNKLLAWIRLVRLPNLFTAPGDSFCGFLLAGGFNALSENYRILTGLFSVCWISFFVYLFGIITNDMADIREDSISRPERPLPSGMITSHEAFVAVQLCLLASIIPSFYSFKLFGITLVLICCVYAYNFYVKSRPIGGSVLMGICRALSFGLGVVIVPKTSLSVSSTIFTTLFGIAIFTYIFGLTEAASMETERMKRRKGGKYILTGALLASFVILRHAIKFLIISNEVLPSLGAFAAIVFAAVFLFNAYSAYRKTIRMTAPREIQQTIGTLVRAILLAHAAIAGAFGFYMMASLFILGLVLAIICKNIFRVHGS